MPGGMFLLGSTPNTHGWNHNGAPKSVKANALNNASAQGLLYICWLPCWRIYYYFKTKLSQKTKNNFARTTTSILRCVTRTHMWLPKRACIRYNIKGAPDTSHANALVREDEMGNTYNNLTLWSHRANYFFGHYTRTVTTLDTEFLGWDGASSRMTCVKS